MIDQPRLLSARIQGYRPFGDFRADFGCLEVIVGANGSGKSSLFEFLKFLRDSLYQDIPPEIVAGSIGRQIFHKPGPDKFEWKLDVDMAGKVEPRVPVQYQAGVLGPIGRTQVSFELVEMIGPEGQPAILMDTRGSVEVMQDPMSGKQLKLQKVWRRSNQLALSTTNPAQLPTLYNLREYIRSWRFYSSFSIDNDKIRRSVPTEQEPILREDAGNLSALLFYLMTEHQSAFDELQQHLRSVVPGFKRLTVKARGGPGEVIAFWQEEGIDEDLSLADLSDGILRLICWMVLCLQPNPPGLICIDEPDQGVHPRTLPILAGLFEKACERTQMLLATHSSYFLMQFDLARIAVMRKENGEAMFIKPSDSKVLSQNLADFGPDEIEVMHRSDELERLA